MDREDPKLPEDRDDGCAVVVVVVAAAELGVVAVAAAAMSAAWREANREREADRERVALMKWQVVESEPMAGRKRLLHHEFLDKRIDWRW
jgi:hypothetical protein